MVAQSCELVEQRDYAHARDLLRQALLIDSKNATARTLLEKVNLEIRRVTLRPKAQQQVEKGKAVPRQNSGSTELHPFNNVTGLCASC
jgi:hypothetical protein